MAGAAVFVGFAARASAEQAAARPSLPEVQRHRQEAARDTWQKWDIDPPELPLPQALSDRRRQLVVPPGTRLMVFAPHPDDETLAGAGLMQRVRESGGTVRVVYVTNGDGFATAVETAVKRRASKDDFIAYGRERRGEALRALGALGLSAPHAVFLGFPDGGIEDLWAQHWSDRDPYTSPFTDSDRPPYPDSFSPRLEYAGSDLDAEIGSLLREFSPHWVLVPDPRDLHPDHSATGIFVLEALRELQARHIAPFARVEVLTYLVHYPDYPGTLDWASRINKTGVAGSSAALSTLAKTDWMHFELSERETSAKRTALTNYSSQMAVMGPFMRLFVRPTEVFGHLEGPEGGQIGAVATQQAARTGRKRRN